MQCGKDPGSIPPTARFYYARVIENPVCRWSTHVCNAQGIDCSDPGSVPSDFASPCCDTRFPKTITERAWTSPIWYRPTRDRPRVRGGVKYGRMPGTDALADAHVRAGAGGLDVLHEAAHAR